MNSATWIKKQLKKYTIKEIYAMYDEFVKETGSMMNKESFKGTVRSANSKLLKDKEIKDKSEISIEYKENEEQIINIKNSDDITNPDETFAYLKLKKEEWEIKNFSFSSYKGSVRLEIKPIVQKFDEAIKENFIKDMIKHSPKCYKKIKRSSIKKDKCMAQINIFDLHFGLLSWFREVGVNYDIKIAEKLMHDTVDSFLYVMNKYQIEKILFPIGSDFYNVNNAAKTTAKGTLQDEDCRWQKSFERGRILIVSILDKLRNKADVDVLVIPGNHDTERSFYLGDAIYCWYHNDPCVNIDNEPTERKYYQYQNNLIGLTHGSGIKDAKLAALMPFEAKKIWSNIKFAEVHRAHKHHETVKTLSDDVIEIDSIKVRGISSLTAPSAWSKKTGYIALREAQMFIWHPMRGNIAQFNYHI
jgi:hypothetical protein